MLLSVLLSSTASASTEMNGKLRAHIWATDPCLAWIVDHEDGTWDPTRSYGNGHDVYASYGLPQANPGTKMWIAGKDWATNPLTQLRWMRWYVKGYGGSCGAKAHWLYMLHRYGQGSY